MKSKTKTYSYTISEDEYNQLTDDVKHLFTESNLEAREIIPDEIKIWIKEKKEAIEREKAQGKIPV